MKKIYFEPKMLTEDFIMETFMNDKSIDSTGLGPNKPGDNDDDPDDPGDPYAGIKERNGWEARGLW